MAGLSTSTNYSSVTSEAARIAQAQQLRSQEDVVAAQLRQTFGERGAEPGTTITAKYQYKVAADGSLYPTSTKITTEVTDPESSLDKQASQKRSGSRRQSSDASLAGVSRPRPELSPTDELSLFSDVNLATRLTSIPPANNDNVSATVVSATVQGEAEDADGAKIDVEILPPQAQASSAQETSGTGPSANLTSRAQQVVANLYARNADAAYNQIRNIQFAA